ncbi:hypothetical protein XENTR_v10002941 [Xenopus tropicalis]|uniref:Granzyme A n=1 Tax=Xenopus tropicalis TaxID=8364 RepID=A0A8J0QUV9_XENTR|eukprot:XP_002941159.1 PREDICTED: granzyme A-like [Xenopus tropicalis]
MAGLKTSTVFLFTAAAFFLVIWQCECTEIIGGREAVPHSRPYMVALYLREKKFKTICGGVLIKPSWVLTAAHCNITEKTKIIIGAHSLTAKESQKQIIPIIKKFQHEDFRIETFDYDVQLLQLSKAAVLGSDVSVLPLSVKRKKLQPGTVCETAGWGTTTNHRNIISDKLMEVNVTIVDTKTCAKRWKPLINITRNMICTSENVEVKGTCGGDSGGPLICNGSLRGLTSFGMPECALPGDASVYAKLNRNIIRWINKIISGVHKIF